MAPCPQVVEADVAPITRCAARHVSAYTHRSVIFSLGRKHLSANLEKKRAGRDGGEK
jgi:hypothetical protein